MLGAYVLSGFVVAFLALFCLVPGVVRALLVPVTMLPVVVWSKLRHGA